MSMRTRCLVLAVATLATVSTADESDQYLVWGRDLADSGPAINQILNTRIAGVLDFMNEQNPGCACCLLTVAIMSDLHENRLGASTGGVAEPNEGIETYPSLEILPGEIFLQSIYRQVDPALILGVAHNIRIGNAHFGIDKFDEFFGLGRRYYMHFQEQLVAGLTPEQAEDDTIRMGVLDEATFLGSTTEGVFSFADLEAAYQGLLFAMDLCGGSDPRLVLSENRWIRSRLVDISPYISPYYDETFLPPLYSAGIEKAVYINIERNYAQIATSEPVANRFSLYRETAPPPSRSLRVTVDYLRGLKIPSQFPTLLTALGIKGTDSTAPWNPFSIVLVEEAEPVPAS